LEVEAVLLKLVSKISWCVISTLEPATVPDSGSYFRQRLYHVDEFLTLKLADELQLEAGEDAPMSIAAHPDVRHSAS
jgi:hypothetical protein